MGRVWLVVALGCTGCTRVQVDLEGRSCVEGGCADGYECHPDLEICSPAIERACPGGDGVVCWSSSFTGESCQVENAWLPCGPGDDCIDGCRTCLDGQWTGCGGSVCVVGTRQNCSECGDNCGTRTANVDEAFCNVTGPDRVCDYDMCLPDFVDADGDRRNGCECRPSGAEVCNGLDDDCDGQVDEPEPDILALGCGAGESCVGGACACGGATSSGGPACAGQTCCADTCVAPDDPACACGMAPSCAPNQKCCGAPEACTTVSSSAAHCGDCDTPCPAASSCVMSQCRCDNAAEEICGTTCVDTTTTATACGSCTFDCTGLPGVDLGQSVTCDTGACQFSCLPGFEDCDGSAPGCETDLTSTAIRCGACTTDCTSFPNVQAATCIGGMCALSCAPGFADCDGDPTSGCAPDDAGQWSSCPGLSCAQILADGHSTGSGAYWINPDAGAPFRAMCDMANAGGGWTLLMKATRGNTFEYDASYWSTPNTLNPTDLTLADADAKYDSFNRLPVRSLRAVWPDFTTASVPWVWLELDIWSPAQTGLVGFNTFRSLGLATSSSAWSSAYFSAQANQMCGAGNETGRYGFNLNPASLCNGCPAGCNGPGVQCDGGNEGFVRWGFRFNENGCCNWATDDAGGGIGMKSCSGHRFSAGDWVVCCESSLGANRDARVEVWGR